MAALQEQKAASFAALGRQKAVRCLPSYARLVKLDSCFVPLSGSNMALLYAKGAILFYKIQ